MKEMTNQQRLNLVNSDQIYDSYRAALAHDRAYKHGIKWKKVNNAEYLVRGTRLGEKSLGVRNSSTELIYKEFISGRASAKYRLSKAVISMQEQAALNKALKLTRAPEIVAKLLRKLDSVHALSDFMVIGTQAMYCYESMSGVHFISELLASGDVDLLFDPRKSLSIVSKKIDGAGLLGLLRQVDRSFEPIIKGGFRAHNADNFMVDIVIPQRRMSDANKIQFSADDLVATEVPGLQWLCNSPKAKATAIDEKGFPFPMITPDPRAFAIHKAWLSHQAERDPVKKKRDLDQAKAVARVVTRYLPILSFDDAITSLHGDVRTHIDELEIGESRVLPPFNG